MKCPFCKIEIHELILEEKNCFCIVNYEPLKDGHVMVLPKRHIDNLSNLKPIEARDLLSMVNQISEAVSRSYKKSPVIFMNTGTHCTQSHLHFHILPSNGGLRDLFGSYENIPGRTKASKAVLKKTSQKIIKKIKSH